MDINTLPTYVKDFHHEESKKMIYRPFGNTGLQISVLGFGGSQFRLIHGTDKEQEGVETAIEAIKLGINYIDTAPYYGQGKAEIVLGKALKHIPRQTYYLTTKVCRYGADFANMFDFSAEFMFKSIEESLERLGVDYFDVVLVHDLEFAPDINIILNETLPALQKLKDMGKTKFIGISGYPISKLKDVLEKSTVKIDVVQTYCRCTLFDDTLMSYMPFFKEKGVAVTNAAYLGMGLLTNPGPPDWHPATQEMRDACAKAVLYCKEKNVDISKLAFCHALFRSEDIHVHLVGVENKALLKANLEYLWNGLSEQEQAVKNEVLKMFSTLSQTHWENVEVNQYGKALASLKK